MLVYILYINLLSVSYTHLDFDETYKTNARSKILHNISINMGCREEEITSCISFKNKKGKIIGFSFNLCGKYYTYNYFSERLIESK